MSQSSIVASQMVGQFIQHKKEYDDEDDEEEMSFDNVSSTDYN